MMLMTVAYCFPWKETSAKGFDRVLVDRIPLGEISLDPRPTFSIVLEDGQLVLTVFKPAPLHLFNDSTQVVEVLATWRIPRPVENTAIKLNLYQFHVGLWGLGGERHFPGSKDPLFYRDISLMAFNEFINLVQGPIEMFWYFDPCLKKNRVGTTGNRVGGSRELVEAGFSFLLEPGERGARRISFLGQGSIQDYKLNFLLDELYGQSTVSVIDLKSSAEIVRTSFFSNSSPGAVEARLLEALISRGLSKEKASLIVQAIVGKSFPDGDRRSWCQRLLHMIASS